MLDLTKWNSFSEIENIEQLEEYLDCRGPYRHTNFFHYTSLDALNSIIGSRKFLVSNVSRFNDLKEKEVFNNNEELFYSLCFSTGVNENLPLWYLYSGLDGKGGRIKFTSTMMRRIVDYSKFYLCEYDYSEHKEIRKIFDLTDDNSTKEFRDVLYCGINDDNTIKYNTMTNRRISLNEISDYRDNYKGFVKNLIWYYEKETRLLININLEYKKTLEEIGVERLAVMMDFQHIGNNFSINLAPEIEVKEFEPIKFDLKHDKLKELYILSKNYKKAKIQPSQYAGQVKMNLCTKCSKYNNKEEKEYEKNN